MSLKGTSLNTKIPFSKTRKIKPPPRLSLIMKIPVSGTRKIKPPGLSLNTPEPNGLSLNTPENLQIPPNGLSLNTIEEIPNSILEQKKDIILNKTYTHIIEKFSFGNLSKPVLIKFYKDGRHFAPVIELYLQEMFPLIHVSGCKIYDFTDDSNNKYDEKTFTKGGCKFMPSSMIGTGRKFDKVKFDEKATKLIYIIVSNINFPEIKIKFVRGKDLIIDYPNGKIPAGNFYDFFT